jgi:hypothetical protein
VTTSTCADWEPTAKSTTTTPTPTPTASPLAINEKMCYHGSDFPNVAGHIDDDFFRQYIPFSCATDNTAAVNLKMSAGDDPVIFHTITNDEPYFFSIQWIPGCKTSVDTMSVWQPVGTDDTCYTIMQGNNDNCECSSYPSGSRMLA